MHRSKRLLIFFLSSFVTMVKVSACVISRWCVTTTTTIRTGYKNKILLECRRGKEGGGGRCPQVAGGLWRQQQRCVTGVKSVRWTTFVFVERSSADSVLARRTNQALSPRCWCTARVTVTLWCRHCIHTHTAAQTTHTSPPIVFSRELNFQRQLLRENHLREGVNFFNAIVSFLTQRNSDRTVAN